MIENVQVIVNEEEWEESYKKDNLWERKRHSVRSGKIERGNQRREKGERKSGRERKRRKR